VKHSVAPRALFVSSSKQFSQTYLLKIFRLIEALEKSVFVQI
jgi:hypothetical protein